MSLRFLFGPERQPEQRFPVALRDGRAAAFTQEALRAAASWQEFHAGLPRGFEPDVLAFDLSYNVPPPWLASAPLPVVAIAGDSSLLWHGYRLATGFDRLLADAESAERLVKQGVSHVRPALLYGVEQVFLDEGAGNWERDIDVLFVGNMHPHVQAERLPWLARLAKLRERHSVVIASDAWGADYRTLLRRARIVFNRSVRGEWNRRMGEALAAGALVFCERSNREVPALLRDGVECVFYQEEADLEEKLEFYLANEERRRAIADAGHARCREFSFERFWERNLAALEAEWPAVVECARVRVGGA